MKELVEQDLTFERKERLTEDAIEIFEGQGLDDKVKLLRTLQELYTVYYKLDGLCDSYYGALAPSTGVLRVFDLQPYKEGMLLLGPNRENPSEANVPIQQEKMFAAFTDYVNFNHIVGVSNVGELNKAVMEGQDAMLINVSEALHNNRIASIADDIKRKFMAGGQE